MNRHIQLVVVVVASFAAATGLAMRALGDEAHPHVVLLIGEDEYETDRTVPAFAASELTTRGLRVTAIHADKNDPNNFPGLDALKTADLLLVSVRRRTPPAEQLNSIRAYVESGRPVAGIRTASHAFALRNNQPPPAGHAAWPEFDAQVLGGHYTGHHPAPEEGASPTVVSILPEKRDRPILAGLPREPFAVGSSLYKTSPLAASAEALMLGRIDGVDMAEPVAWTNTNYKGGRVFYTSLGHPDDFKSAAFRKLLVNGILWALADGKRTAGADEPQRIALWQGHAPLGNGEFEDADAWITVHRPAKCNGAAIVICPGGGYGTRVVGAEGHGIAEWLNRHRITGVVLEYRLPAGRSFVPLLDAQRALRTVRAHAKERSIDPSRIGIMGFSAGGHLASTAGTHFDDGDPAATDPIDRVSCRPDFMILVYPVIVMGQKATHQGSMTNLLGKDPPAKLIELFSNEKQVTARTPPTFLAHALDDKPVPPENSKAFYDALQVHKVSSVYLELPSGGHGLNGYKGPMWDEWQEKSLAWLGKMKFVPADNASGK
jgi:acetyl esterase/lipase